MTNVDVHAGFAVDVLRALPDASVDLVVTDPPYGLSDHPDINAVLAAWEAGHDYMPSGGGFMGAEWDAFVPGPAVWAEVARVLTPTGVAAAFTGSRTADLTGHALTLGGLALHHTWHWTYGCLTDDCEILTESGWRLGTKVNVGDRVAQWDPSTGEISLEPVQRTYRAPWDGPMRVLRNADTDQVLTPNHRVWHRPRQRQMANGHRRKWFGRDWQVAEASELSMWNDLTLPVAGTHSGAGIGGDDYARLLGWVWTEGGFDRSGTGVRVYQSSVNAANVAAAIAALMDRMGPHKRYDRDRQYKGRIYTESTWFMSGSLAERIRTDLPDKRPTYDLLWRMTTSEKEAFLDAAMLGDGSGWGGTKPTFFQKEEVDLIWLQTLLATVNRAGKVTMRSDRPGGSVSLRARSTTELQTRHLRDSVEHYRGDVWCVTVPSGAFVARRNGMVFITGNSGFPKSLDVSKALDKAGGESPAVQAMVLLRARERAGLSREGVAAQIGCTAASVRDWEEVRARVKGGPLEWVMPSPGYRDALADLLGYTSDERRVVGATTKRSDDGTVIGLGHSGAVYDATAHTELAARWQGWGTALKPAHEPVWIATRPDHPGLDLAGVPVGYAAKANSSERVVAWLPACDCFPDPHRLPGPAELAWEPAACGECGRAFVEYQHPTVKPVAGITRLLSYLGMEPGMTVLDPFAGTGTTAVAAIDAHAGTVITVDADPVHAAVTQRRVDAATAAPTLL